jgi:hypothetical protein
MQRSAWSVGLRLVRLPLLRRLGNRPRVRTAFLLTGLCLIPLWQAVNYLNVRHLDPGLGVTCSSGIQGEARFAYFLHYLNLYPVTTVKPLESYRDKLDGAPLYSRAGARRLLAKYPGDLVTEHGHTTRYGDHGKTWLYLLFAWLRGTAEDPSCIPLNALAFVLALELVFLAFWYIRQPVWGAVLTVLAGSNPFQLFEVYGRDNIFGWPITACLFVLALCLPLLAGRKLPRLALLSIPVAAGLLLATVRQVRTEPALPVLAAAFACLAAARLRLRTRLGLLLLLGVSFWGGSRGWQAFFHHKIREADRLVGRVGGHPYPGPRDHYHMYWHPIFCGLGDFDTKYGYAWDDRAAAKYALPVLKRDYGVDVPVYDGGWIYRNAFWDADRIYYKTPYELPHYQDVLRDKVLHDVRGDPLWYANILAHRLYHLVKDTTPVRAQVGRWTAFSVSLPPVAAGLLGLVVVAVLVMARQRLWLKVLCLTLPTSLLALLVYAKGNACHYSCYHLVVAAIVITWGLEAGLELLRALFVRGRSLLPAAWRVRATPG